MGKDFSMKDFLMELSTNYQQVIHMLINKFIHNSKLLNGMRLRQNGTSVATKWRNYFFMLRQNDTIVVTKWYHGGNTGADGTFGASSETSSDAQRYQNVTELRQLVAELWQLVIELRQVVIPTNYTIEYTTNYTSNLSSACMCARSWSLGKFDAGERWWRWGDMSIMDILRWVRVESFHLSSSSEFSYVLFFL